MEVGKTAQQPARGRLPEEDSSRRCRSHGLAVRRERDRTSLTLVTPTQRPQARDSSGWQWVAVLISSGLALPGRLLRSGLARRLSLLGLEHNRSNASRSHGAKGSEVYFLSY